MCSRCNATPARATGTHRGCAVDKAGDHQPVGCIEEQNLGIHAGCCGGAGSDLLRDAVDVFTGAGAGDPQYQTVGPGVDEVVDVGEAGQSRDLGRIHVEQERHTSKGCG